MIGPKGMRFFKETEDGNIIAIEYPPQKRTIFLQNICHRFFLRFPYSLFMFRFDTNSSRGIALTSVAVAFSETPIQSTNDIVFQLPLGDIYKTGIVCLDQKRKQYTFDNVPQMIDKITGLFWQSPFESISLLELWKNVTTDNNIPINLLAFNHQPLYSIARPLTKNTAAFRDE